MFLAALFPYESAGGDRHDGGHFGDGDAGALADRWRGRLALMEMGIWRREEVEEFLACLRVY